MNYFFKDKNIIVLKHQTYRFKMNKNEIIVPPLIEDLYRVTNVKEKAVLPKIGFVGFADYPSIRTRIRVCFQVLKAFLGLMSRYEIKGIYFRKKIIKIILKKCGEICEFIIRDSFGGNRKTINNFDRKRAEYIQNINESDYVLCIKGDGNYSLRFYEALSAGRIPIFVDTSCVLPLEDMIDYKKICLFCSLGDVKNICHIVKDNYKRMTNDEFKKKQKETREIYQRYLKPSEFYKILFFNILPKRLKFEN